MTNDFSPEDREVFNGYYKCFLCGGNRPDCLHHIVGRGKKGDDTESSPLNAFLVCNLKCHIPNHNELKTEKSIRRLLDITYNFLQSINYKMTEKDAKFVEKYIKYYY